VRTVEKADIDHWHQHGYVIVEEFLDPAELEACRDNLYRYLPTWEEYVQRAPLYQDIHGSSSRSSLGWVRYEFPYVDDPLNMVTLHPFLVGFVERLVGHSDIALSHGAIVGKYAGKADYDQELHSDYTNNTLVYPPSGVEAIDIPMIVYYTDVNVDLGPTYVVSAELTRDMPPTGRRFCSRAEYPHLYAAEKPATLRAGSVLIYSMRTLHRGSAIRASEGMRFSQFIGYHTAGPLWLGSHSFQGAGGRPEMDRLLTCATPRQRELLGFPPPGDAYWDEETLAGVAARYPEMDISPYRDAR
jgi:ectoine hydroxylase-related dioxygenase (phytanoyl-CoA dioxygenase family)